MASNVKYVNKYEFLSRYDENAYHPNITMKVNNNQYFGSIISALL